MTSGTAGPFSPENGTRGCGEGILSRDRPLPHWSSSSLRVPDAPPGVKVTRERLLTLSRQTLVSDATGFGTCIVGVKKRLPGRMALENINSQQRRRRLHGFSFLFRIIPQFTRGLLFVCFFGAGRGSAAEFVLQASGESVRRMCAGQSTLCASIVVNGEVMAVGRRRSGCGKLNGLLEAGPPLPRPGQAQRASRWATYRE